MRCNYCGNGITVCFVIAIGIFAETCYRDAFFKLLVPESYI